MAESGDPKDKRPTEAADHDHDAQIGFFSPSSLMGQPREPEPQAEREAEPEPVVATEREPDLFDAPEPKLEPEPEPVIPAFAQPESAREDAYRAASRGPEETPPAAPRPVLGLGLYAVYALILFAVPTLGVSAVIGLLAVTGREGPREPLAANHFIYQQRTLWIAAVAALLGVILVVVNIGVFVLFVMAVWVLLRGAYGVLTLKAGKPIRDPRTWLF